ncbi:MAG: methyltransferase domain-containing protein [Chloroflexota bacterium]
MLSDPENLEYLKLHSLVDFSGKTVLEIGSGDGRLTELYHDVAQSIVGIDLDFDDLQIAQEDELDNVNLLMANAFILPVRTNMMDVVLFARAL